MSKQLRSVPYPKFTLCYGVICFIVLLAYNFQLTWTFIFSKPLIVVSLFLFFSIQPVAPTGKVFRKLILAGLLFSLIGDVSLMFTESNQNYFLIGLISFLLTHLVYTVAFVYNIFRTRPWRQHWGQLAFSTMLVVYGAEFYILNRFSFGDFWLPVLIYCMGITIMGISAVMRDKFHNPVAFFLIVIGAVFFIFSDSFIAINKFVYPLEYEGLLILPTYMIAQYLIVIGCLKSMTYDGSPVSVNWKNQVKREE